MRLFSFLCVIFLLTVSAENCSKKKKTNTVYKARLEIKAICSNYTLTLLEGNIDTSLVVANWTDETTGKSYKNAFGLDNPCYFPDSIKQGDEFYFSFPTTDTLGCVVCMAYYPTPPKKLSIKVIKN